MSYQPPLHHPVYFNGTAINTQNWQTGTDGVAITRIDGWFDAPDVRDTRELNPGRDGELADNLYLGGRTITIEGLVSGSSYADLQTKKTALTAKLIPAASEYVLKLPLPTNTTPSWTHADTMTDFERVNARVIDGVQFGDNQGPLLQSWAVTLRASDPLVYNDTLTTVDSGTSGTAARTASVTNAGTYPSPGKIVVTGPTGSDWSVVDSDSDTVLAFSGLALAATTSSTEIDLQARTIKTTQPYKESRLALSTAVSLWMLDETSGTTADNAEGTAGRDGTYTGGYTLNQTGPATGLKSVDLNGTTGYISVPYSAALWGGSGYSHLWEFWINLDTVSGTQTIMDSISSNRGLQIRTSGTQLQWRIGDGSTTTTVSPGISLAASKWYRLRFRLRFGSEMLISLDDISTGTSYQFVSVAGSGVSYAIPTATGLRFGSTLGGADFLNGKMGPIFQAYNSSISYVFSRETEVLDSSKTNSGISSSYDKLNFASALWSSIDTGSTTYTLDSTGLNTGSKLSIQYRTARL